jgi:hypothetical protein
LTKRETDIDGNVVEKNVILERRKTVATVLRFQDLPEPRQIKGLSLVLVDPNGKALASMQRPVIDASMHVSMDPPSGRVGSPVTISVDLSDYLRSLQMEYFGFDPSAFRLKIDYSMSGGVTGPGYCEVGPNGKATIQAKRGSVPGSFPVGFNLVPKAPSAVTLMAGAQHVLGPGGPCCR